MAERLRAAGHPVELVEIRTSGDLSSAPVAELGVGVFVSALREALVSRGEVDVAVHSYKDLPTAPDPRLLLAAVPPREDPRDALVARDGRVLGELPAGARVGTGSPRRRAQLDALGLGLEVVPIRGNVDTRIGKVGSGELDAVVVAAAGLRRLGRIGEATELLDPLQMLPAPAQGALAVECRAGDEELARALAAALDDESTRVAVAAERALLAALEAGCSAPVGALAEVVSDLDDDGRAVERISLRAVLRHRRRRAPARPRDVGHGQRREARAGTRRRAARPGGPRRRSPFRDESSEMNRAASASAQGRVEFVGSGPGDPGLLTVRAREALAAAPLIVTDPDVPGLDPGAGRRRTPRCGRPSGSPPTWPRDLVAAARDGRRVTRLVSGDPLTVDSVVQEAVAVAAAGVPFDVVPGVPAGTAVPAYAGVPLGSTHLEIDVRTGVDWPRLAAAPGVLVLHATAAAPGRGGQRVDRVRHGRADAGRGHLGGRHHQAADGRARRWARWPPSPASWTARWCSPSVPRSSCAASCPGGSRARCTAGGCWCRGPRTRPAR